MLLASSYHLSDSALITFRLFQCVYNLFFFFNDTATTEIYTLSLHDALPIYIGAGYTAEQTCACVFVSHRTPDSCRGEDRKSTRLNSSHQIISYAVFCLKKKNKKGYRMR